MPFTSILSPRLNPPLVSPLASLVLTPHPDDEVLGCGGTVRSLVEKGRVMDALYLTDGSKGSADGRRNLALATQRKEESRRVGSHLGVNESHYFFLPDGELDHHIDSAVQKLSDLLFTGKYDQIFCPWPGETHSDHRATFEICRRSMAGNSVVQAVWLYEVWSPLPANALMDISPHLSNKLEALSLYESQNHEVLKEKALCLARYRAIGQPEMIYAEAFFLTTPEEMSREDLFYT